MINSLSLLISTFLYIGKIKYAPGTFASLVTLFIWILFIPADYFIRILIIFFLIIIGFISIRFSLPNFRDKDPQIIVIDEVAGMSIALLFINDISIMVISFLCGKRIPS